MDIMNVLRKMNEAVFRVESKRISKRNKKIKHSMQSTESELVETITNLKNKGHIEIELIKIRKSYKERKMANKF